MRAFVFEKGSFKVTELPKPEAGTLEAVVAIKAAGLNRRDLYTPGRLGNDSESLILGSDAAGVIEAIGEGVTDWQVGDEVIINPSLRWYENSDVPPADFDILSFPDNGTFAEKIAISVEQLERKPAHLSFEEASVIGISPLTGYRALFTKGQIEAGQTIFIPGAGSGVATFLIQMAKNVGARVIVSSRSEEKRNAALEIGADVAIDTHADWVELLKEEQIDVVIESVGRATFNRSLDVLKKGGKIVLFGATTEEVVDFDLRKFFYGQYTLYGTTMGSREEFRACLEHLAEFNTHPVMDRTFSLDEAEQALEYLKENHQFGKITITI
ncbi:zinc-binding dehydrogenase [Viridibacillus arvi]|uniref:Alcohol dehydrogenase n=1 Tax=Viridibacillus arvi TaxID=263475 RepID=A0A0M0LNE1_9BACL|nr:zinc-binding dehydrogenase [Viridibacillus arvi]KOO52417.1 alcohol dehydrogenase [Viridibacillus arvi]